MAGHELKATIVLAGKKDASLNSLGNSLTQMGENLERISRAAFDFEKESVETYKNYEDGILEARSVLQGVYSNTNDLEKVMNGLETNAQQWAASTIFGTADVASAIANAAHAGWDYEQIVEGMPNAMLIAQAGNMELSEGLDYMTKILAGTGTAFEDSHGLVNMWAKAADTAATDIVQVGDALIGLGSASSLADSNEEILTMVALLANAGTVGSEAGTAIRNIMARIAAPTDKATEAMASLGLTEAEAEEALGDLDETSLKAYQTLIDKGFTAYDADGNLRPMLDIFRDMNAVMGDMDEKSRNDVLKSMFGTRSFQYAMTMMNAAQNGDLTSIYDAILGVRDGDYAEAKAETLMSGLSGSAATLSSKWEEFQRKVGSTLAKPLQGVMGFAGGIVDKLNAMDPVLLDGLVGGLTTIAGVAPALITAGGAIKLIAAIGAGGMVGTGIAIMGVAAGVGALAAAIRSYENHKFSNMFGDMSLDNDAILSKFKEYDTVFTSLSTNAAEYNTAMETALSNYETASVSLSGSLLTSMITGSTLDDNDKKLITDYGNAMATELENAIDGHFAADMTWMQSLFSYNNVDPTTNESYNLLIQSMGESYDDAISDAKDLGKQLGEAIASSVEDGVISGDEYAAIAELMQKYNKAIAKQTRIKNAGEESMMLHRMQTASWESYADLVSTAYGNYKVNTQQEDDYFWTQYGERGQDMIENGIAQTDIDTALQGMYDNYFGNEDLDIAGYRGDYRKSYMDQLMAATQATLSGSGMWDAFEFMRGYDGVVTNDAIEKLTSQEGLLDSLTKLNSGFIKMDEVMGPFLKEAGIDTSNWQEWTDQLIGATQTQGALNTEVMDNYNIERLANGLEPVQQPIDVTDNGSAAALHSSIESEFSNTITQHVNVEKSDSALDNFATGGRATQASIFGEAGAEWAIPERHTTRTAELLDQARAASGFTWPELISRNGGLNAGGSGGITQIVYSPTINAGDTSGVGQVLKEDKASLMASLDKWWRDRQMKDAVASYT